MIVLSLFDGISCGRIALARANIPVTNYYASEIDKVSIRISKDNWKDVVHIGDVTEVKYLNGTLYTSLGNFFVGKVDLLIGGSPCQSISNLGDGTGLAGKSGLFYHYLRIRDELMVKNPSLRFLLENVSGKKEALLEISNKMGVGSIEINSNLVSAQNRKRLYWTNIQMQDVLQDKKLRLKDVLDTTLCSTSILTSSRKRWFESDKGQHTVKKRYSTLDGDLAGCLTARSDASWNSNYVTRNGEVTKLSCTEYERLQNVPENYTAGEKPSHRYRVLGNGWTVDVIAHIFKNLVSPIKPNVSEKIERQLVLPFSE